MQDGGIDAGLYVLCQIAKPGQTFPACDIAYVCGVKKEQIDRLERQALFKIRQALKSVTVASERIADANAKTF